VVKSSRKKCDMWHIQGRGVVMWGISVETWGKESPSRPRRRWEDKIKMDLKEIEWEGVDWINRAQDRDKWRAVVNTVMNTRVS
jgi:hypothetical protein